MGNRNRLGAFQPVSNLLGTPLVTQFALDPPTTATRPFERTTHLSPSVLGALVRDLSKVAIGAFIAFQLTRDRRAVHTDHLGNPTGGHGRLCATPIFRIFEVGSTGYIPSYAPPRRAVE